MKIHWLQHVEFEGLGCIEPWLTANGHTVTCTRLWAGEHFSSIGTVDGLIIMGGPMGISDDEQHPWLAAEKVFIKEVIDQNRPVLGICLGAQLIADSLGAKVWRNKQKEIGFFPIHGIDRAGFQADASKNRIFPDELMAFHWHGDTFNIPDGAVRLASSEATKNQAFLYRDNVLALQFHLETTEESLQTLYKNCADEITSGPFIQSLEATALQLANEDLLQPCNDLMRQLLGRLFASA
ncbi:MAG: type 1 glutamine amidotransferase [Kiritimatiellaceae bacterium]|nr:type 1 glutamine amidotransferase [Kiritimatiellaceae bacterium]